MAGSHQPAWFELVEAVPRAGGRRADRVVTGPDSPGITAERRARTSSGGAVDRGARGALATRAPDPLAQGTTEVVPQTTVTTKEEKARIVILKDGATVEELVYYWKGQVDPFYDPANGTVAVRVRAFAAADALRLAQTIVAASERLVNELSARARRDALHHAEAELGQTESRLKTVLAEMRAFRDREGLIDPARTAETTGLLSARLRDELVRAKADLATLKAYMRDDAPSVKVLKARIHSLEAQRTSLAREMTDPDAARPDTLSRVLGSYEQLESERKFAEASYQLALRGLDQARANADRQRVFIASFIPPRLPEEALYPRRWRALGTVALIAFALWAIGGLAVQSVRDHLA